PPSANHHNFTTTEDTSTHLALTDSDVAGPVTVTILSAPTNGVLSLLNTNTGAVIYTPNTNYNGADSFTFTVSDGSLLATGLVSIAVTPINDVPVATDDNVTTADDTSIYLLLTGGTADDMDPFCVRHA